MHTEYEQIINLPVRLQSRSLTLEKTLNKEGFTMQDLRKENNVVELILTEIKQRKIEDFSLTVPIEWNLSIRTLLKSLSFVRIKLAPVEKSRFMFLRHRLQVDLCTLDAANEAFYM